MTAVAVLAAVLMLWGSTSGDSLISAPNTTFDIPQESRDASAPSPALPTLVPGAPSDPDSGSLINGWLVLQILVGALIAWFVVRFFRNREPAEPPDLSEAPDPLTELLEATAVDHRRKTAFGGEPRNAVVACWVALEDGLSAAGLTASPSETSLDLTLRVLHQWQVPAEALNDLALLYREARFSRHPITEAQRDQAVDALRVIHTSLMDASQARSGEGASTTVGSLDGASTSERERP
ncbi:MAG: DUF4129 domain-containing protein [Ornithinimicrobium sp.]